MMTVDVIGVDEVLANVDLYFELAFEEVLAAVEQSAVVLMNHAKSNHERGGAHAIGRFETQTGALVGSIHTKTTQADMDAIEAQVISPMEYSPYVEYGTSRSRAYPFMVPAMVATEGEFVRRVQAAVQSI